MKETNEQKIAHAEIRQAVDQLMRAAKSNKTAVIGYVWGADPPLLVRFGNIREDEPDLAALLLKLDEMTQSKIERGLVRNEILGESE